MDILKICVGLLCPNTEDNNNHSAPTPQNYNHAGNNYIQPQSQPTGNNNQHPVVAQVPEQIPMQIIQQYKNSGDIPVSYLSRGKLQGICTLVMDGDTIKFFHRPGNETVPKSGNELKNCTMTIRLAGIDCPETSHGPNKPGQPYGDDAKEHLKKLILNQSITLTLLDRDQYGRIVALITMENGKDASCEMLRAGLAHLYKGKGASYGNLKQEMENILKDAQSHKRGLWSQNNVINPGDYKKQYA